MREGIRGRGMTKSKTPLSYAERRKMLLVELRLMRLTNPARRVVKHQQRLMRGLRFARSIGAVQ